MGVGVDDDDLRVPADRIVVHLEGGPADPLEQEHVLVIGLDDPVGLQVADRLLVARAARQREGLVVNCIQVARLEGQHLFVELEGYLVVLDVPVAVALVQDRSCPFRVQLGRDVE